MRPTRIVVAGGLIAAGATALGVYHRLSGARLLADLADELVLRATDLDALAARDAARDDRAAAIVSLTTIPSRIGRLATTLKSLLRQTCRAEIRINVPDTSVREMLAYEVPAWLQALSAVRLVRCDDEGPATKLIPTLLASGSDDAIIVVDDDRIYGERLVEELMTWSRVYPDAIVAASGWRVPVDLTDRPTTLAARLAGAPYVPRLGSVITAPVEVDVVQGLHGYLVKPRFFDRERLIDFSAAPPEARFCDDVWISAHARVPKYVVPVRRISVTPVLDARAYKRTSLARSHNSRRDVEQRANTVMIRYFSDVWRAARE